MGGGTSKQQYGYALLRASATAEDRRVTEEMERTLFKSRDLMDFEARQKFVHDIPRMIFPLYTLVQFD